MGSPLSTCPENVFFDHSAAYKPYFGSFYTALFAESWTAEVVRRSPILSWLRIMIKWWWPPARQLWQQQWVWPPAVWSGKRCRAWLEFEIFYFNFNFKSKMQILWRLNQRVDQDLRSWFSLPDFLSTGGKSFSLAVFLETRESVSLLGLHALGISSIVSLIGALCSASMIRVRLEGVVILLAAHSGKQGSEVRSQGRTGTLVHSTKSTPPSCTSPTNAYIQAVVLN